METIDKQNIRSKAFSMKAIMGDKNLARAIFDSWDAPPGSVKNKKAKSILKSIHRPVSNFNIIADGKGGPGYSTQYGNPLTDTNPLQNLINNSGNNTSSNNTSSSNAFTDPSNLGFSDQETQFSPGETPAPVSTPPATSQTTTEQTLGPDPLPKTTKFIGSVDDLMSNLMGKINDTQKNVVGSLVNPIDTFKKGVDALSKTETLDTLNNPLDKFLNSSLTKPYMDYINEPINISEGSPAGLIMKNLFKVPGLVVKYKNKTKIKGQEFEDEVINPVLEYLVKNAWYTAKSLAAQPLQDVNRKEFGWGEAPDAPEIKMPDWIKNMLGDKDITPIKDEVDRITKETIEEAGKQSIGPENKTNEVTDPNQRTDVDGTTWTSGSASTGDLGYNDPVSSTVSNYENVQNAFETGGVDGITNYFNSLGLEDQASMMGIDDYVKLGIGSETTARQIMGDKEALKALGMTDEILETWPSSGFLSESINDLRDSVKKEYQIDKQLDNLLNAQGGDAFEANIQNYIKGKDEYLGQLDKLIFDGTKKIANMDTSNPYVAQRMKNYMNYLTIAAGRQNQRYIDFLDTAVTYNTARIDQMQKLYDSSIAQANEEFNASAAVTTELHDSVKDMITDMYDNIEKRSELSRDNTRWEWEKITAAQQIAENILDLQIKEDAMNNPETQYDKMNIDTIKEAVGITENDDGSLNFSLMSDDGFYDPFQAIQNGTSAGQSGENTWNQYKIAVAKDVQNRSTNGEFLDQYEKHKGFIDWVTSIGQKMPTQEDVDSGNLTDDDKANIQSYAVMEKYANELESSLVNGLSRGIKNYFTSSEERIQEVRSAIEYLSFTGWGKDEGYPEQTSESKFNSRYRDALGDYTKPIYDMYVSTVNADVKNIKGWQELTKSDDNSLASSISNSLTNYFLPKITIE